MKSERLLCLTVETQENETAKQVYHLLGRTAGDYRQVHCDPDGCCRVTAFFGSREALDKAKDLLIRTLPGAESYLPAVEDIDAVVAVM